MSRDLAGSSLGLRHQGASRYKFSAYSAVWNGSLRRGSPLPIQIHLNLGKRLLFKHCWWLQSSISFMPLGHDRELPQRKQSRRRVFCRVGAADNNNEKALEVVVLKRLRNWEYALKHVNVYIPHAVVAGTALALPYPPSFTWFTTKYYASALGFLMLAVGVNWGIEDVKHAFERPGPIALSLAGQYIVKPLLGVIVATIAVQFLHLPDAIGSRTTTKN